MIKGIRKSPEYTTYTYEEQEFKDLLGIGNDPDGVLAVHADFTRQVITVTMDGTGDPA